MAATLHQPGNWANDADLHKKHARKAATVLSTASLAYASLGIIYGDIGTSPLYTYASILGNVENLESEDVIAGFSLMFWSLTLVVLIKYVLVVLRADDNGEGGTFALYTRLSRIMGMSVFGTLQAPEHTELLLLSKKPVFRHLSVRSSTRAGEADQTPLERMSEERPTQTQTRAEESCPQGRWWNWGHIPAEPIKRSFQRSVIAQRTLLVAAILATSMVFGDGVLTPAISVLGALSGLTVAVEGITQNVIVGVSCAILVLLFAFQYKGTQGVARLFSPIVVLWLASNAAIGIWSMSVNGTGILKGLSPSYIYTYFSRFGSTGWEMLGAVMLTVTGTEAMFADLGHFNYAAVAGGFGFFAYPCLVITYLGQGAYLLQHPEDIGTTYWSTVPSSILWPMLVLATLASVVASQALISACFSICKQAKQLGFFPKFKVVYTSQDHGGQIYVAFANWILMILCVAVVAGFKGDTVKLGQAYGLNISLVMLITTFLVTLIMVVDWQLSVVFVAAFLGVFGLIEGAFVSANFTKVASGAWVALAIAAAFALFIGIWWIGQRIRMRALVRHSQLDGQQMFTFTAAGPKRQNSTQGVKPVSPRVSLDSTASAGIPANLDRAGSLERPQANAIDLGLLRGELSLSLVSSPKKPLAILPGIGIFHSDNANTVPAVMRHFLRNIEAVHQVNLFLSCRFLPVPFIAPEDRFLVRAVPQLPTFYSAIARYGYMDTVDHGQAFINRLITALANLLCDTDAWNIDMISALRGDTSLGPTAEGVLDMASPAATYLSPFTAAAAVQADSASEHVEIRVAPALRSTSLRVQLAEPRMSVDLHTLSRSIEASNLGREVSRRLPTGAASAFDRLSAIADAFGSTAAGGSTTDVEASLRVVNLIDAAKGGIVYYFGRSCLRMEPDSNIFHNILLDNLYRPMLLLSYAEHEAWKVPVDNLVELGMVVFI